MRFLHTADWHLGRHFHGVSLIGDQAYVLDQLVDLAGASDLDAVVIAGDVYDRSVPPSDAVRLLDDVLERLVIGAGLPTILIAGNHDSDTRLGFGSRLMSPAGLHVFGPLDSVSGPVVLRDDHGEVHFCPIPYADPAAVRLHFEDDELRDHQSATRRLAGSARALLPEQARAVAIGHCWVTGGNPSESERPLTVGGTGEVGADCFDGFAYTALGHLHRPQKISDGIEYSGSILKYSFSEADHGKSASIVEIDGKGRVSVERVDLVPRRDVRIVEGSLHEIRQGPKEGESAEDYLLVRLSDRKAILDVMSKLREVYPNVLHVERPAMQEGAQSGLRGREYLERSEVELFQAFHEEVTGDEIEHEAEVVLTDVVSDVRKERKEAGA